MPISDWTDPATCEGEEPPVCVAPDEVATGRALLVSGEDNCPDELISDEYPAIPLSLSNSNTRMRSGSTTLPIKLPLLQVKTGDQADGLHGQTNADGTVFDWKPTPACYNRRLVNGENGWELIYDQNSNVFDEACIGTLADVDYITGGKRFEDCDGNVKIKLVFFDKTELVPES